MNEVNRNIMKVKAWCEPKDQICTLGRHTWSVPRLFELSRNFPVMDVPLNHLHLYYTYEKLTLREMVSHIIAINNSDLGMPIIIDEDGEVMDGRHRLMKAILQGEETIKAVRFEENPPPCRVIDI